MNETRRILLVEDNDDDVFLFRHALRHLEQSPIVDVVIDGKQAIDYLTRIPPSVIDKAPNIIILDLDIPKVDGYEVLRWIRTNLQTLAIPVIILSGLD